MGVPTNWGDYPAPVVDGYLAIIEARQVSEDREALLKQTQERQEAAKAAQGFQV